jgi:hypothetical protein
MELSRDTCRLLSDRCAVGVEPIKKRIKEHLDNSAESAYGCENAAWGAGAKELLGR